MSGGFTRFGEVCNQQMLGISAGFVTVVTCGAANTKGSWVQIAASTVADCDVLEVGLYYYGGSAKTYAFDVGVGASGSEVALISNIIGNSVSASFTQSSQFSIPIFIPAGTRLSMRAQSTTASDGQTCAALYTYSSGMASTDQTSGVDTIGFVAGTTVGTAVTPSATANTKGSYVQLTAATARDYQGFFIRTDSQLGTVTNDYIFDIAIGASGSETVIYSYYYPANANMYPPPVPIQIPAGTRIAVRCACDGASGGNLGVTFYGLY